MKNKNGFENQQGIDQANNAERNYKEITQKMEGFYPGGLMIPEPTKHLYDIDPLNYLAIDKIKDLPNQTKVMEQEKEGDF